MPRTAPFSAQRAAAARALMFGERQRTHSGHNFRATYHIAVEMDPPGTHRP